MQIENYESIFENPQSDPHEVAVMFVSIIK